MHKRIHEEAAELLLEAMFQQGGDGWRSSFMFGRPGAPRWERSSGAEVTYGRRELIRAAIFVRQNGPTYFKYLSIDRICHMLVDFVTQNYWYLANETWFTEFEESFAKHVSTETKEKFAEALSSSKLLQPQDRLSIFPLVPVQVETDFDSEPFFLIKPASLNSTRLPSGFDCRFIDPLKFPPHNDWKGHKEQPNAWLGIRSPQAESSEKMKAAVLGALALTPLPQYRHMFSKRAMFGGHCTFNGGSSMSLGDSHTPPMMHDIIITERDHEWLNVLASKLVANERSVRRQLRALEYFYRAWKLGPSERFPILCMALDATFGEVSHTTQAVIDGVRNVLGSHIDEARLRKLMDLRASVIHGGAPDVYDSRTYAQYYYEYEADPIHDLELIMAACLRMRIFGQSLREHADPNAEIIAKAQEEGILPKEFPRSGILEGTRTFERKQTSEEVLPNLSVEKERIHRFAVIPFIIIVGRLRHLFSLLSRKL